MYKPTNLLIVDDDPAISKVFEKVAVQEGWTSVIAASGTEAIEFLTKLAVEVAVVDINLPGYTGVQVLEYVKANKIPTEIIMITGAGTVETAVTTIKLGAYDYLTKPFDDINKVANVIAKAIEHYRLIQKIRKIERQDRDKVLFEGMIGKSKKIQDIFDLVESVAPTNSTILILGESGTGKELVAHAIHNRSRRADRPFVVINCAAMPESLLESELFGHRKGSFTGAIQDKKGLFEQANGGTIFLDEIGEIAPQIQVKLLRVLQEGEIRAVGDNNSKNVDVRIIAATNKELSKLVKDGRFREDLYYRLNVISMQLPPLRDRADDIPTLAYHFLQKYATKTSKGIAKIAIDAMQALQNYNWTGNVRELENVVERAVVLATTDTIEARDLPPRVLGESFYLTNEFGDADLSRYSYREAKEKAFLAFNKSYLSSLLRQSVGNASFAATKAGMDRSNFKKIIKKYGIDLGEFKKR